MKKKERKRKTKRKTRIGRSLVAATRQPDAIVRLGKITGYLDATLDDLNRRVTSEVSMLERMVARTKADLESQVSKATVRLDEIDADRNHPTVGALARRLVTLETAERISKGAHERLNTLEHEVRSLREDLGRVIAELHEKRNLREVEEIARREA